MEEKEKKADKKEEKSAGKNTPMIIGGVVLIVIVLVIGGIFAMQTMSSPGEATESETSEFEGDGEFQHTGIYFRQFDAFITCLDHQSDSPFTYLKFVPQFELSDSRMEAEIIRKMPLIEDRINSVMSDLDWDDVKGERGRDRQGERLRRSLNELLESGEIIKIYFTTFVAQ